MARTSLKNFTVVGEGAQHTYIAPHDNHNEVRAMCEVRDHGVPRSRVREMCGIFAEMPREKHVELCRKQLNEKVEQCCPILSKVLQHTEPTNVVPHCSAAHALDVLGMAIAHKLKIEFPNDNFRNHLPDLMSRLKERHQKVDIVLQGDGHPARRRLFGQTQMSIRLVFDGDAADTVDPTAYLPLFIYDGKESTEFLRQGWEMANADTLVDFVNTDDFLNLYFCSDWKFEAAFFARKGPTAKAFCVHCSCDLHDKEKLDEEFEMLDEWSQNGTVGVPICRLEPHQILCDVLHCWLRISHKLFKLFWRELEQEYSVELETAFQSELRRIGITNFSFYFDDGVRKWNALTGVQCEIFFKKFEISSLVRSEAKVVKLKKLWSLWLEIGTTMRLRNDAVLSYPWREKIEEWKDIFLFTDNAVNRPLWEENDFDNMVYMYSKSDLTPYMHKLISHIPQFFENQCILGLYSCDTLELTNRMHRQVIERGKTSGDKTKDVMEWCFRQVHYVVTPQPNMLSKTTYRG